MAEKENGGRRRGSQRYFSLLSCLVFMVFDRARSLSPSISLFTFKPILEVAAMFLN